MKTFIVITVILFLVTGLVTGCAFLEGVLDTSTQIELGEFIRVSKETGKIDSVKMLALLEKLNQKKGNALWNFLYTLGVGSVGYLTTRRIRKSPIGAKINAGLCLLQKLIPKKEQG